METQTLETVRVSHADLPYEQRHISEFKDFDWSKATKWDAVSFARASGFKETGMSVNEIALMYDLLEQKKPRKIVELGRNYGCSTRLFMQHVYRHGGVLSSWDLKQWEGFVETMGENNYHFYPAGKEDFITLPPPGQDECPVNLRVAHSIKTPIPANETVDFLLIDTEHSVINALGEYLRWRFYLNSGALVAFHDSTLPAVARAIEMVKECEWNEDKGRGGFKREYILDRQDGFGIQVLERW